jgi:hypothetical protein
VCSACDACWSHACQHQCLLARLALAHTICLHPPSLASFLQHSVPYQPGQPIWQSQPCCWLDSYNAYCFVCISTTTNIPSALLAALYPLAAAFDLDACLILAEKPSPPVGRRKGRACPFACLSCTFLSGPLPVCCGLVMCGLHTLLPPVVVARNIQVVAGTVVVNGQPVQVATQEVTFASDPAGVTSVLQATAWW